MSQKPDPYELEGVKRRAPKPFPWLALFFALIALVLGAVILSPIPEKIRRKAGIFSPKKGSIPAPPQEPKVITKEKIVEKVVKVRPSYYEVKKGTDVSKTSMGFDFKSRVEERPGRLASSERKNDRTYEASFTLSINRPEPAKRFDEVVSVNPKLPKILPGLEKLMDQAKVSPFYRKLYDNKVSRLKTNINRMDRLLTKHNYYDCQTMLELEYPGTKRKVFLMQADMDVVSDGSDGDRLPTMPEKIVNSPYYQPATSYAWTKTGSVENPMIAGRRKLLEKAKAEGDADGAQHHQKVINDLKRRSFLIADHDPFIVVPIDVARDIDSPYGPNYGDYVVVIHDDKIYPAIVGDGGPTFKVGEASLRMAKEINKRASSYSRPVSEVNVTYIVFPRSSGKWAAPNYDDWRNECLNLVNEIGGLGEGYVLHRWENTLPVSEEEAKEGSE